MDEVNVLYRDYRIKVYLNARHYIFINGKQGQTHPHTWEFVLYMRFPANTFIQFTTFEKAINIFLERYQNQVLNDYAPFNEVIPTLENITEYFTDEFSTLIYKLKGLLLQVVASETPTRSYVVNPENNQNFIKKYKGYKEKYQDKLIEDKLDSIFKMKYNY